MTNSSKGALTLRSALAAAALAVTSCAAVAQDNNAFEPGWVLSSDTSVLRFQSVKNETKVESSSFGSYTGFIDDTGLATIKVALDSVDTNVDLRNVRMRFLMFETFKFPEATITMQIAPETIADLEDVRRKVMDVSYTIDLHGVSVEKEAEIAVTLLDNDKVSVTSATPISLALEDFDLMDGREKLQNAAKVAIIPSATVTFDFTFDRATSPEAFKIARAEKEGDALLQNAALEQDGDFTVDACKGRFEIMSRTDSIYFASGGSRLEDRSAPLLDSISEIAQRCPNLVVQIIGHTDSDGSEANNQRLSEARAQSVREYLQSTGVSPTSVMSVGVGETQPAFPNDTPENKRKNRRIEFKALSS
ncbi:MAG: OmpA family protein [Pseudomonadota bacterium]